MSDFDERLRKAIDRGQARNAAHAREAREKALTEDQLKNLHGKYRLSLSEHIEKCVGELPNHFPGFRSETIYGQRGWGAACNRDDVGRGGDGKRSNFFSRIEMTIRPYSSLHVLELTAKGTVRNRELFNRRHFEKLQEADTDTFRELIDVWVLEYAELFAAKF